MITASGFRRSNKLPMIILGGAPTSVASSKPKQNRLLEVAVGQARAREALVKSHRPRHARHAANAVQIVFRKRFDVVGELHVAIHHPNAGALNVANLAARLQHQAAKDRRLLRDQAATRTRYPG